MSKELDARIALAENWTGIRPSTLGWGEADLLGYPPGKPLSFVPRWSSDLNLMWELESLMNDDEIGKYLIALLEILTPGPDPDRWVFAVHATAEQKARAWLKVKEGK